MPRTSLILILVMSASLALSAAQKGPAAASARPVASAASGGKLGKKMVAPTDPVITIRGLCARSAESKPASGIGACKTVVSRRDFESFVKSVSATAGDVEPSDYLKVAQSYFGLLLYSESGQQAGVDKDPRFQQLLETTRLRALGDMYRVHMTEQAQHIPDQEIAAYYQKNIRDYEEVDLDRFQIPKNNMSNLSDADYSAKAKKLAEDLHARAVKGEDITKLEKEAVTALGLNGSPNIEIGVRQGQFKDEQDKAIFGLRQGEVTPVMDAAGLWMFFKRTSRETLPLALVKNEIRAMLYENKTVGPDKALHDAVHVDYNEAYFAAPLNTTNPGQNSATTKLMAPGDVVITIHGLCGNQPESGPCDRVVTREQFDPFLRIALMNATSPTSAIPHSIAQGYVDDLIYADAAEKAGLDKDPRLPGVMMLVHQRALTDLYRLSLDEKAHAISPQEIETYYAKNSAAFEELTLTHISVPRQKPATAHDADFEAKARRLAYELHDRAANGEDMEKLQKEVYQALGLETPFAGYEARGIKTPPLSSLKPIRRGSMEQQTEAELFELKPGQSTSVRELPTAYVFYKLESRRTMPLEEAKTEISQSLYQKNREQLKTLMPVVRAEYNGKYFASASADRPASAANKTVASQKANSPR